MKMAVVLLWFIPLVSSASIALRINNYSSDSIKINGSAGGSGLQKTVNVNTHTHTDIVFHDVYRGLSRTARIQNTGEYCYPPGHYGQLLSLNIFDSSGATTKAKSVCAVEKAELTLKDDGVWFSRNDTAERQADGTDSHFIGFTDLYYYFLSLKAENKARTYSLFPAYKGEKDKIQINNFLPDTLLKITYSSSPTEVEKYRVTVCKQSKNRLCDSSGQPLNTGVLLTSDDLPAKEHGQPNTHFAGRPLPTPIFTGNYVLTTDGELYILKLNQMFTPDGRIRYHSYMTAGQPVAAAGELAARQGEILYIDNSSGHYRPDCKHSQANVKAYLKKNGYSDVTALNFTCFDRNPLNAHYVSLPQTDAKVEVEETDHIADDPYDFFYTATSHDGRVYAGYSEGVLMSYEAEGSRVVFYDPQEAHGYTFTEVYPAQDYVYGLARGALYSLHLETSVLSEHEVPGEVVALHVDGAVKPNRLYVATQDGSVYQGQQSDGMISWQAIENDYSTLSHMTASGEVLFASDETQVHRYQYGQWSEVDLGQPGLMAITALAAQQDTLYIAGMDADWQSQVTVCEAQKACRALSQSLFLT